MGGYNDLNDFQAATLTLDAIPNPGEKISIIRHHTLEVGDAMLKLTLFNEPFLRGGLGKIWFELENTGAAEIEIVTAQNSGSAPGQAGFFIEDTMDNVLSAASLEQALGDKVITLANKQTVARIPAGTGQLHHQPGAGHPLKDPIGYSQKLCPKNKPEDYNRAGHRS